MAYRSRAELDAQLGAAGFHVTRVLGEGGSGVVLEALTDGGRTVALKVLHGELAGRNEAVRRFFREARVANALSSPGLVDVLETGWIGPDGIPYIAMERLEGRSLMEELGRRGTLPLARARRLILQILGVLELLHENGIVHRDLKPANVFLVPDGVEERVKLLDLGISKVVGSDSIETRAGQLLGTPAYMAPEQIANSAAVDGRSDLWAVGAILFEMLVGQPPFEEGDILALLTRRRESLPPRLSDACPDVDPSVAAIVDRCLRVDPAERFQDCASLRAALLHAGAPSTPRRVARSTPSPPAEFARVESGEQIPTVVRPAAAAPGPLVWVIALLLAALVGLGLAVLVRWWPMLSLQRTQMPAEWNSRSTRALPTPATSTSIEKGIVASSQ